MSSTWKVRAATALTIIAAAATLAAAPGALAYAPVNQPGPRLDVAAATLRAALTCPTDPARARRDVVLLIPGTTVDPDQAFSWNWEPALRSRRIPYCTITVPNHTDNDIQVAAEYVVYAVRTIARASHHKVVLFGWSQGASTLPRWAIRWWPDVRPRIASLVGLAPLNNIGSVVANSACASGSCVPAAWQQAVGAAFMAALNSGRQTFPGIAYTAIWSRVDDVVTPDATGALSVLPPGRNVTNVAIQDVCPEDLSDHLAIPASPTAFAIALDAIDHPGQPARLSRVHVSQPCLPGTMPGVTPAMFTSGEQAVVAPIPQRLQTGRVSHEPRLRCYVFGTCSREARRG